VLHPPLLLGELGFAIVLAGSVLTYRASLKETRGLQTTAGLLLISGSWCGYFLYTWLASAVTLRLLGWRREAEGAGGRLNSHIKLEVHSQWRQSQFR
jgi:hypothetical protein